MSSIETKTPHDSAVSHVTGESVFVDDRPAVHGEVLIRVIGSPIAAGKLKKIDSTKALKIPGVVAVYDQRDFPNNRWGTIVRDQPILVENEIGYADEPICIIVGETREALRAAKNALVIEVDEAKPVLAIEKAIDK
ncbi:MAG: xanthine dehydrogenase molybdopterin binding subunit, partial [Pseudobdellovibrionaceae bacterium]